MKGKNTMKYKVIKNGKRIVPEKLDDDMILLKHTHSNVVYARRSEWVAAKINKTVNRQVMLQNAQKFSTKKIPKFTKKEKEILIKNTIKCFIKFAEAFENKNKIISSAMFGEIVKDIKSQNNYGLQIYGHMSEEQYKGLLQEISLLV